jgi:2-polyprenyl-3-methyl-5-hydroxy-6-metoxy-1,4-benzoquinol methylase
MSWNHNTHYHGFVMSAIPRNCRRALDVGCGRGTLAWKLASHCEEIVGIDTDARCLTDANVSTDAQKNITFVRGDVLTHQLEPKSFDFVVAVASLHHLPLRAALQKFSDLLGPGGVLAIVGLYRITTPVDYAFSVVAFPISWIVRSLRGEEHVGAPLQDPTETLRTIRREAVSVLPGAVVRRQFFFRYTILWRKPD